MCEPKPPFGQPDIVRLSDEDASVQLLERAIEWGRRSMLGEAHELASAVDFTIPHRVSSIEETGALIRSNRDEWLRAQAAAKPSAPPERA